MLWYSITQEEKKKNYQMKKAFITYKHLTQFCHADYKNNDSWCRSTPLDRMFQVHSGIFWKMENTVFLAIPGKNRFYEKGRTFNWIKRGKFYAKKWKKVKTCGKVGSTHPNKHQALTLTSSTLGIISVRTDDSYNLCFCIIQ